MSKDGETSTVIKGVEHGACDYLRKPIRLKDVRCIWIHDYRNKLVRGRLVQEDSPPTPVTSETAPIVESSNGGADDSSSSAVKNKKARFVWTPELCDKFNRVVQQIKESEFFIHIFLNK